jgi:hypothetical protein
MNLYFYFHLACELEAVIFRPFFQTFPDLAADIGTSAPGSWELQTFNKENNLSSAAPGSGILQILQKLEKKSFYVSHCFANVKSKQLCDVFYKC